ncbi:hypothetical protein OVA24_06785 [Luteolibacter sp. SL250]|uniref:hypothetical protein n=1 Tax=Luteolibacter sp. SL250 TaxID=2995170 RepID=UPI002271A8B1|nr:hypothetical protein [Luteolibacter sp. SL250]WAC21087.1 hypothetical protein OVA24_06785 [Luteolibacter sp. SL250]
MKIIKSLCIVLFVLFGLVGFVFMGFDLKEKWDARVLPDQIRKGAKRYDLKGDGILRYYICSKPVEGMDHVDDYYDVVWNSRSKVIEVYTPVLYRVNGEIKSVVEYAKSASSHDYKVEVIDHRLYGYLDGGLYIVDEPVWEVEDVGLVEIYHLLRSFKFGPVKLRHRTH